MNVSMFRKKLSYALDMADLGEMTYIHRGTKVYALISIPSSEIEISDSLKEEIEKAREDYRTGNFRKCSSAQELDEYFESL